MNETVTEPVAPAETTPETVVTPKAKPKPLPKKTAAAKPATPAKTKKAAATAKNVAAPKVYHGVTIKSGKFWNAKRILIVEALRSLGAESAMTSRTYQEVAKKAGSKLTDANVVRYCSDREPLVAGGLVKKAKVEDSVAVKYYLTALGKKCKFDY